MSDYQGHVHIYIYIDTFSVWRLTEQNKSLQQELPLIACVLHDSIWKITTGSLSLAKSTLTNWWYTYPPEKYEFVRSDHHPIGEMKKSMVPNHQPVEWHLHPFDTSIYQDQVGPCCPGIHGSPSNHTGDWAPEKKCESHQGDHHPIYLIENNLTTTKSSLNYIPLYPIRILQKFTLR